MNLKYNLTFFIIILIGFQQFPVLRIGGSLKVYEILAIILLLVNVSTYNQQMTIHKKVFFSWILFVISPIISLLVAYLTIRYPTDFFLAYPKTSDSFKFNYEVFPILQLLYMFFCFSVISTIYTNKLLYRNTDKVIKISVIIGTCIAIYSLIACFTTDIIIYLPEFIQHRTEYIFRSCGLSQEPSFYVLYQGWIVLFTYYSKKIFKKITWILLMTINIFSLLLTFSTSLIGFVIVLLASIFLFKNSKKIYFIFICFLCISGGYLYITMSNNIEFVESIFINKAQNFFSSPNHTMDSGSFRSYTARIGLEMFKDYPITGVGVGNSVYYMHKYDSRMGIVEYGETLHAGIFPQNTFTCVLAEQGLIGGIGLFFLIAVIIRSSWKNRNKNTLCKVFFIGCLFNIIAMFAITPVYSLFIWVFMAFALGYYNYLDKIQHIEYV
jgi:O-antigen ligase